TRANRYADKDRAVLMEASRPTMTRNLPTAPRALVWPGLPTSRCGDAKRRDVDERYCDADGGFPQASSVRADPRDRHGRGRRRDRPAVGRRSGDGTRPPRAGRQPRRATVRREALTAPVPLQPPSSRGDYEPAPGRDRLLPKPDRQDA